jgi:hypothetical protein
MNGNLRRNEMANPHTRTPALSDVLAGKPPPQGGYSGNPGSSMRYPEGENIPLSAPPGSGGRIPSTPSGDREKPEDSSAESKIKARNDRINNIGDKSSVLGRGILGTGSGEKTDDGGAKKKEYPKFPPKTNTIAEKYKRDLDVPASRMPEGSGVGFTATSGGGRGHGGGSKQQKNATFVGAGKLEDKNSGPSLTAHVSRTKTNGTPAQWGAGLIYKVPLDPPPKALTPSTPSASESGQSDQRGKRYDPWGQSRDASTSNASQSDSPARPLDIRSNAQRGATASGKGAHPSDQQKQPSSQHGASARERFFAMTDKLQNNDLDGAKQVVQGHRNSPEVQAQLNAGHQHNQHNQQIAAVDQSGSEIGGRGRG